MGNIIYFITFPKPKQNRAKCQKTAARSVAWLDAAATPGPKNCFLCLLVLSPHLQTVSLYLRNHQINTKKTLFALDTFHMFLCVHNPTKRLNSICMFTCSCTTNHLTLFPSQLLEDVSLCTCTVFIWSIRTVCMFQSMYRLTFIYSIFIVKICQ